MRSVVIAAALATLSTPAFAQGEEGYDLYAVTRGISVYAILQNGAFKACRFEPATEGHDFFYLNRDARGWQVVMPQFADGMFAGAILSVDKSDIDVQFGFENGMAVRGLSEGELAAIRAGHELRIEHDGMVIMTASLAGSAAAILKGDECFETRGNTGM